MYRLRNFSIAGLLFVIFSLIVFYFSFYCNSSVNLSGLGISIKVCTSVHKSFGSHKYAHYDSLSLSLNFSDRFIRIRVAVNPEHILGTMGMSQEIYLGLNANHLRA